MSNTDMSVLGVQKEVFNPFLKVYVFPFYTRGRIQISLFLLFILIYVLEIFKNQYEESFVRLVEVYCAALFELPLFNHFIVGQIALNLQPLQ